MKKGRRMTKKRSRKRTTNTVDRGDRQRLGFPGRQRRRLRKKRSAGA